MSKADSLGTNLQYKVLQMKIIQRWTNLELVSFGDHWYELHHLDESVMNFSTDIFADDDIDATQKALCIVAADARKNGS
jgi:hypothetical protein